MNGESVFGWLKVAAIFLVVLLIGFIAWKGWAYVKGIFTLQISASNPISRAIDKPIAYFTGGDSLGTWLASVFSSESRAASAAIAAPVVLNAMPVDRSASYLYGDDNPPATTPQNRTFLESLFGGGFSDGSNR